MDKKPQVVLNLFFFEKFFKKNLIELELGKPILYPAHGGSTFSFAARATPNGPTFYI